MKVFGKKVGKRIIPVVRVNLFCKHRWQVLYNYEDTTGIIPSYKVHARCECCGKEKNCATSSIVIG